MAREAGWVTAHLMTYPLGLIGASSARHERRHDLVGLTPHQRSLVHFAVDAAATPILLVHGIVDNHTIFSPLERALRRRGFTDLSSFDYGLLTSDVRSTAQDLAVAVEKLVEESGADRVHVIGHSLGGLISRYYVQRMGGHERVHTVVTLGTPHQGTVLARAGSVLPLIRQLRPDSDLIAELNQPAPDCDTRFIAFHSDLDQLIVPGRNARIVHPDLRVRNVAVRGIGHMSLTNNSGIAFQIAAALAHLDDRMESDPHEATVAGSLADEGSPAEA
ncbi:MAG TPA: alpha/beta fold hydrolase [Microlunatus sp.]|nr:alpha/beta fold hydrolase [Microlunatus sp.]